MQLIDRVKTFLTETPGLQELPSVDRVVREITKRDHESRQKVVEARVQALAERDALIAADAAAQEPLRREIEKSRAALETAERGLRDVQAKHAGPIGALTSRITQAERSLRLSASPRIDEARRAIDARYQHDRHAMARSVERPTGEMYHNLTPVMRTVSNDSAIRRVIAAMNTARAELDTLYLSNPVDLEAAIAAIVSPVESAWAAISELDDDGGPIAA